MSTFQPGDLWRDQRGELWFVFQAPGLEEPHMRNSRDFLAPAGFVAGLYGPLTLVHREEASS